MKPREPRRKVLIAARVRWDGIWSQAKIRNISSRGLMLGTAEPPPLGTCVEISVASRTIVARVVWSSGQACGLRLQDVIDVDAFTENRAGDNSSKNLGPRPYLPKDWVAPSQRQDANARAEHSHRFNSVMQMAACALFGGSVAVFAAQEVFHILSNPFQAASAALS